MLKLFNERVAAYSYGTGVLLQFDDMQMDNTSGKSIVKRWRQQKI